MAPVLFVLGALCVIAAGTLIKDTIGIDAQSAMQQTVEELRFLKAIAIGVGGAIFISGGCIVAAINGTKPGSDG